MRHKKSLRSRFIAFGAVVTGNEAFHSTVAGSKLTFKGGVCYRDSTGFYVNVGTSLPGKRRRSDPPW